MNKINFALTGLLFIAAFSNASASVIGGAVTGGTASAAGGTFVELVAPFTESNPDNTVGNDTFQSNNLFAFDEAQNVVVAASEGDLNVDILASNGGNSGTLAVGTVLASHYVFFDPSASTSQTGFVDFDSDILAVITTTDNLADSDYLLNNGVVYLNPGLRGLEANVDSVEIDAINPSRLNVEWRASTPGDYVRVLTEFSPGALGTGAITGVKWWDVDNFGTREFTEELLAGWTIELLVNGDVVKTTETDSSGFYMFDNLTAGDYSVREVLQPGWEQTFGTQWLTPLSVVDDQTITDIDFGNRRVDTPPAGVPSPATLSLLGLGIAGIGFQRRKAHKKI